MLGWAVTFLIIALVAAVFGFGGIAAASAGIAKFLFFLFLVMCVLFFFLGWRGRRVPYLANTSVGRRGIGLRQVFTDGSAWRAN